MKASLVTVKGLTTLAGIAAILMALTLGVDKIRSKGAGSPPSQHPWVYHPVDENGILLIHIEDARAVAFEVGFHLENGTWVKEQTCASSESAAERVHWLNGGERLR